MANESARKTVLTEEDVVVGSGVLSRLNETVMRIVPEGAKVLFIADKRFRQVNTVYDVLTRKFRADKVEVLSLIHI